MPIELIGLDSVPRPGDHLVVVKNDKIAREIVSQRKQGIKNISAQSRTNINDIFANIAAQDITLTASQMTTLDNGFAPQNISGPRYPHATQLEIDTEEF